MTPQEKAIELVKKYSCYFYGIEEDLFVKVIIHDDAIECALIAVDEILDDKVVIDGIRIINDPYWIEVKQEIEKL